MPLLVDLPDVVEAAFIAADWFIWAAFAFEYLVQLILWTHRWRFIRKEWRSLLLRRLDELEARIAHIDGRRKDP